MRNIYRFLLLFLLVSACSAERHHHVRFVNNSNLPIRVYNQVIQDNDTLLRNIEWMKIHNQYYVPAKSINEGALSARLGRYFERLYEDLDAAIFVLDASYTYDEVHNRKSDDGIVLVRYTLSLEDFRNLDWELSFPPDERMRHIHMWPPYEEVVAKYAE